MEINELIQENKGISEQGFSDLFNQTTLDSFYRLSTGNTGVPTHTPKSFKEQFYFTTTGQMYVYVNGTWYSVGGSQSASGNAQAPASTGNLEITTGFAPKAIFINCAYSDGTYSSQSNGMATSTSDEKCIYSYWNGSKSVYDHNESFILLCPISTAGESKCAANLAAVGTTSFTLNFQDVTVRPTYHWIAIG